MNIAGNFLHSDSYLQNAISHKPTLTQTPMNNTANYGDREVTHLHTQIYTHTHSLKVEYENQQQLQNPRKNQ